MLWSMQSASNFGETRGGVEKGGLGLPSVKLERALVARPDLRAPRKSLGPRFANPNPPPFRRPTKAASAYVYSNEIARSCALVLACQEVLVTCCHYFWN